LRRAQLCKLTFFANFLIRFDEKKRRPRYVLPSRRLGRIEVVAPSRATDEQATRKSGMVAIIKGRVWKFGDNINTDLMMPNSAYELPPSEQPKSVFSANRPGWSAQVKPGDIIIGGSNFGTGSSRPAAKLVAGLGIAALVAESINGLFLRNCVNFGLPAFSCPSVSELFDEGDTAIVDYANFEIKNEKTGRSACGARLPESLVALTLSGGIVPLLQREGFLS
jgi:3-isopropylmalate/(R)-2-methylmalate dehydratase small subunit